MKNIKHIAIPFALAVVAAASQAATIQITSRDPAGVGFNDTTPVAPVGGNAGTTLGEQRMNVYKYVAHIWEQALDSDVTITVNAGWEALTCTSTSAVLGSASPWNIWHDFPGGKPGTWYPQALANKLAHTDLSAGNPDDGSGYGNVDIKTQFNVNLGKTGCLDNTPFYLGLDGNAGSAVNFVETLEHELGHGLGFTVLTVQTSTGYRILPDGSAYAATGGLPSVWEGFMYDNTAGKTWFDMTSDERKASAINPLGLAWKSAPMLAAATATLKAVPTLQVATPAPTGSGFYDYSTASFGAAVVTGASFGALATVPADPAGAACAPLSPATAAAVNGKVAIIDRGTCAFTIKAKNAQNAGATGVIIANNVVGAIAPGGSDPSVVIRVVGMSLTDATNLKAVVANAAKYGTRSKPGVATSAFAVDPSRKAGADAAGRPLLYTPALLAAGSSVSHWDVSAFPNLLMEPNINADLTTSLVPPLDLTKSLLSDIGW
jgi:hypothetical protein